MIYGAMLAGGSGTRVKSSKIPKQFIEIGGKPIIIYTLENMLKVKRFDYIYIAVHKDYEDYMNEQVKRIFLKAKGKGDPRRQGKNGYYK